MKQERMSEGWMNLDMRCTAHPKDRLMARFENAHENVVQIKVFPCRHCVAQRYLAREDAAKEHSAT